MDCILALKSFYESKRKGRQASCKYGGILKPTTPGNYFILKNSDAFMNKNTRNHSAEAIQKGFSGEQNASTDCFPESSGLVSIL